MLTIAVDAMGGDFAPKNEVQGAILAAVELDVSVVLVGVADTLRAELSLPSGGVKSADSYPSRQRSDHDGGPR